MDARLSALEQYTAKMADVRISRHPLRRDCIFIVNCTEFDIYQDGHSHEEARVLKQCIVKKNPDMFYVQESFGDDAMVQDGDIIPWVIYMSCTGLPRLPMLDDRFLLDGLVYSVSAVKPINRDSQGVIECLVYPERRDFIDSLAIYSVSFHSNFVPVSLEDAWGKEVAMQIIWGGYPIEMSWDKKTWVPFVPTSSVTVPNKASCLFIRGESGEVVGFTFGGRPCGSSVSVAAGFNGLLDSDGVMYITPCTSRTYVN